MTALCGNSSMFVLHAAEFANRQALAGRQQLLHADVFFLARLQTFSCAFMGRSHGAVPLNVFFGFLVTMLSSRYRSSSKQCNGYEGY